MKNKFKVLATLAVMVCTFFATAVASSACWILSFNDGEGDVTMPEHLEN